MVRVKKITSLWLLVALSSGAFASTGWKSWADGQINTNYSSATSIKTQVTSSLQGPQFRARWGSLGRIRPIHFEKPKFSAGCNGIDIGFGSMSFLNFDELVEKLKGIAAAAPAFAFKMAIDTVCSQCSTIMNDLEEIVDEINSMSLDSCSIVQEAGHAGEQLGHQINSALSLTTETGTHEDGYKADKALKNDQKTFLKQGWNSFKSRLAGLSDDAKALAAREKFMYGSVLNNARLDLEASAGLEGEYFVNMARGLVGDVLVCATKDNENYMQTPSSTITTEEFIEALVYGKSEKTIKALKVEIFDENGADITDQKIISTLPTACYVKEDDLVINEEATFTKLIKDRITSTLDQLKSPTTTLTDQDKNFVATLPTNGYVIMNLLVLEKGVVSLDYFAEYIALENARAQLMFILSETSKMIGEYIKQTKTEKEKHRDKLEELKKRAEEKMIEADKILSGRLAEYRFAFNTVARYKQDIIKEIIKGH